MEFNLEEQADSIIQAKKNREQTGHMWFYGFYHITEGAVMDAMNIAEYVTKKELEHPKFTKFKSSVQMFKLFEAAFQGVDFSETISLNKFKMISERKGSDLESAINTLKSKAPETDFLWVHLPVDNSYHLEFPLINQLGLCRFIYTTCDTCEGLEEHGFPDLNLRRSVYFSEDSEARNSMKRGTFMYDNRVSVNHLKKKDIIKSYESLKDFVEATRVNQV